MEYTRSLKENYLFRRVYQKGKSSAGRYLVVYCRRNGQDCNRLGLTAGKKVGHAVVRNLFRRRIREAYRLRESEFSRGYDIIVVARTRAAEASYQELADCLYRQSEKLGIFQRRETDAEAASVPDPVLS